MSFLRSRVCALAAAALAGVAVAQDAAPDAAAADDNKPAIEAIPEAEKEKMDAESAFIKALIEANMPDLAAPVIEKARKQWPLLSAKLEVLEQEGDLRLGHFDKVQAVLEKKKKGSPEYWALSIAMANAYYARQKLPECRKLYGEFFKAVPVPTKELMDFYEKLPLELLSWMAVHDGRSNHLLPFFEAMFTQDLVKKSGLDKKIGMMPDAKARAKMERLTARWEPKQ